MGGGTLINNGDGTLTYTGPAAPGTATFTYTIQDDGAQQSVGTVTLNIGAASTDLAIVDESALAAGSGGGTTIATGNVLTNDGAAGAGGIQRITVNGGTTWITDNGAGDLNPAAGFITANTPRGQIAIDITGANQGDYTYTLVSRADNTAPADNSSVSELIGYDYAANGQDAFLRVTINDDVPIAANANVQIPEGTVQRYSITLVLDLSGSMVGTSGTVRLEQPNGSIVLSTRLQMAKDALIALATEYYQQSNDVQIKLITFSSTATAVNGGVPYTSITSLEAAINGLTAAGNTNYQDALEEVITQTPAPDPTRSNIVYFLSDGVPTAGNTVNPAGAAGYTTYLANNPTLQSYAVGIGSGIANFSQLNGIHNVDQLGDGAADGALSVPDLNELQERLLSTVPQTFGGNVVAGGAGQNVAFGADNGYVQTMTVMLDSGDPDTLPDLAVTFNYNPGTGQISHNGGGFPSGFPVTSTTLTLDSTRGFVYGTLVFDFTSGDYSYYTNGAPQAVAGATFTLESVVIDNDGDTATSTQTITVIDGRPLANDDSDTLLARNTFLEGNVVSGSGTDQGVALGTQVLPFASAGAGVDRIVDGAEVTGIVFQGQAFNLAAPGGGAVLSGTYSVVMAGGVGRLTWTHNTNGSALEFDQTGYYKYTPPTNQVPVPPSQAVSATQSLAAAPGGATGITITESGSGTGIHYNGTSAGVTGNANNNINNNEDLVINFSQAVRPAGVTIQSITVDPLSNLAGANTLTYTFFDINNNQIGTSFTSNAEGVVAMPGYSNVARVNINADNGSSARISAVTYLRPQFEVNLTAAPGGATGLTLAGMSRTSNVQDNALDVYSATGAGVNGGDNNAELDDLESLILNFSQTTHPRGVQGVAIVVNQADSNLAAGTSLTYKLFGVDGTFLGQFASEVMDVPVVIPSTYSGIGQIIVEASGNASARIQSVSYESVMAPAQPGAIQPEVISYTLTDSDLQTSTADLTLNIITNNVYGTAAADTNATVASTTNNDRLVGGAGADTLTGDDGFDILDGGTGNDSLAGGNHNDTLSGGTGNDSMSGDAGADLLRGDAGSDTLLGATGNDQLDGGAGGDSLLGGDGLDTLTGGAGNDTLTGGLNADVFAWTLADRGTNGSPAFDTLTDFNTAAGTDQLDLRDLLAGETTSFAPTGNLTFFLHFEKTGSDTRVHISTIGGFASGYTAAREDQTILLQGVDLVTGTSSDQQVIQNLLANNKILTD